MIYEINGKQSNSKMCFVCGLKNKAGIKAAFYETISKELIAVFNPCSEHQGYPSRLHGGIAAAILDETIGRTITIGKENEVWGVTIELNVKYKKPIPLDEEIMVIAKMTNENKRIFEGEGKIVLPNKEIAVTASGRYLIMPIEKIGNFDKELNEWVITKSEKDPRIIEI